MIRAGGKRALYGWLLVAPFAVSLVVFFVYALLRAVFFSFTDYNLFGDANWVGFANFLNLLQDKLFLVALANSILFAVIVTALQTILALALASVISGNFFGKQAFRVAFYVPSILSSASVTLVFIWFYQKNGFLNGIISSVVSNQRLLWACLLAYLAYWALFITLARLRGVRGGWFDPITILLAIAMSLLTAYYLARWDYFAVQPTALEISWLGTQDYWGPLPKTMWAIVVQNIYTTVPTFMLLFLAGLQGIPKDLYEAARVDGAGPWQRFLNVTLPQLTPVTFLVVTFGVIGTLQMFDQVALLGGAAPLESKITLAYYVYHNAFPPGAEPHVGMASAAALVLALLTFLVVYLQKLVGVRENVNA